MVKKPLLLDRARCVEECGSVCRLQPLGPAPLYLHRRAASGKPFPALSLVHPRHAAMHTPTKAEEHMGTRLRQRRRDEDSEAPRGQSRKEDEEERADTLDFVVRSLPSELFTELLGGLRWRAGTALLLPGSKKRSREADVGKTGTPDKHKKSPTPSKTNKRARKTPVTP